MLSARSTIQPPSGLSAPSRAGGTLERPGRRRPAARGKQGAEARSRPELGSVSSWSTLRSPEIVLVGATSLRLWSRPRGARRGPAPGSNEPPAYRRPCPRRRPGLSGPSTPPRHGARTPPNRQPMEAEFSRPSVPGCAALDLHRPIRRFPWNNAAAPRGRSFRRGRGSKAADSRATAPSPMSRPEWPLSGRPSRCGPPWRELHLAAVVDVDDHDLDLVADVDHVRRRGRRSPRRARRCGTGPRRPGRISMKAPKSLTLFTVPV